MKSIIAVVLAIGVALSVHGASAKSPTVHGGIGASVHSTAAHHADTVRVLSHSSCPITVDIEWYNPGRNGDGVRYDETPNDATAEQLDIAAPFARYTVSIYTGGVADEPTYAASFESNPGLSYTVTFTDPDPDCAPLPVR